MTEIQTMWSWLPAIYLFLGGLAGGTFFISSIVRLVSKGSFPRLAVVAPWISLVALAGGLICLVAEVEKPFQAMMMWQSFVNPSSWMTIGAWLLFVTIIVFGIGALFSTPRIKSALGELWKPFGVYAETITKITMIIGAILGLCVAIYTGILLGAAPSIPLWNSWLIPVLFTISALDAGAAVTIACLIADKEASGEGKDYLRKLQIVLLILVAAEGIVLAALLFQMNAGTFSQALSASIMINGALSIPFWVLVVSVGLGVPAVLGIVDLTGVIKNDTVVSSLHFIALACALVGGFTLRFVILSSGIHGVMVSPDVLQASLNIYQLIS